MSALRGDFKLIKNLQTSLHDRELIIRGLKQLHIYYEEMPSHPQLREVYDEVECKMLKEEVCNLIRKLENEETNPGGVFVDGERV